MKIRGVKYFFFQTTKFRLWLVCFLFISYTVSENLAAQPANLNLSSSGGWDGEPYVAVNPANSDNVIIAWMSFQLPLRIGIEIKSSHDGGNTWSTSQFLPHFGTGFGSADVSMAFSITGTAYLAYIDYRQNPDSGGVHITSSTDGGVNWSAPTLAIDLMEDTNEMPLDRPWIVVDNSATASQGTLYLTSKPAPWIPAPNRPYYKISTDGGLTWSSFHFADTAGFTSTIIQAPMASPAVGANGDLYMIYPAIVGFTPVAVFAKSTDHGATLQRSSITGFSLATDTNPKQAWHLCADPTDSNNLFLTWVDVRNGDLDVYGIYSHNKGGSWSTPIRINDDMMSNGNMQDMVWSSFSRNGRLAVVWRDRRNAPGPGFYQPFDIYGAVSTDGGTTFSANFKLNDSTCPFDSMLASDGNDFLGLDLVNDTLHAAWGDFRSGNVDIFYTRMDLHQVSIDETIDPSQQFFLYPVPAKDYLVLKVKSLFSEPLNYQLEDLAGRIVQSGRLNPGNAEYQIKLTTLSTGVYLLRLKNSSVSWSSKVFISR